MANYNLNAENLRSDDGKKAIYVFIDVAGREAYKTKEIIKNEKKIILYPYSINRNTSQVTPRKIKVIELNGWDDLKDTPKDFRKDKGYGVTGQRIKYLMSFLYPKLPALEKLIVTVNGKNRLSDKTISFNWGDLENVLKIIDKEIAYFNKYRRIGINNSLAQLSKKITTVNPHLTAGELNEFLSKFASFEKMSTNDVNALAKVFNEVPATKILATNHFIETRDKVDIIFFEEIIAEFKKTMSATNKNESEWQKFFKKHTWVLNHIFPYEVILYDDQAFVGGKTMKNSEARFVDFLFQAGFEDNYALLEIKTHVTDLLSSIYRKPRVYSVSNELSGGINQCLDQKDIFLRDKGTDHESMDPKCILIIGQKSKLNKPQTQCFELFRRNQKNVDIITFDELLTKMEGFLKILGHKSSKTSIKSTLKGTKIALAS